MITFFDSLYIYDMDKYYVFLSSVPNWNEAEFVKKFNATKVESGFNYYLDENIERVSADELRSYIVARVDSTFKA